MSDSLTAQVKPINNVDLKPLNTLAIAAKAKCVFKLTHLNQLSDLHRQISKATEVRVLGGGSNLLITQDQHHPVIKIELRGIQQLDREYLRSVSSNTNLDANETVLIQAMAGEPWHEFVVYSLQQGWNGLENLSLIPGTVGASPIQNIGAYGVELRERFDSLLAWNWRTNKTQEFTNEQCEFGYRDSFFKQPKGKDWVVLAVRFALHRSANVKTNYADLKAKLGLNPTPAEVSQAVCAIRQSKLPDPKSVPNAGSFFKNPVVSNEAFKSIQRQVSVPVPNWPQSEQTVKVSAAWLIDQAGWKGFRAGDAGVHQQHALVLVNHGAATGAQMTKLAADICADVQKKFGVALEQEPIVWAD